MIRKRTIQDSLGMKTKQLDLLSSQVPLHRDYERMVMTKLIEGYSPKRNKIPSTQCFYSVFQDKVGCNMLL